MRDLTRPAADAILAFIDTALNEGVSIRVLVSPHSDALIEASDTNIEVIHLVFADGDTCELVSREGKAIAREIFEAAA